MSSLARSHAGASMLKHMDAQTDIGNKNLSSRHLTVPRLFKRRPTDDFAVQPSQSI